MPDRPDIISLTTGPEYIRFFIFLLPHSIYLNRKMGHQSVIFEKS